MTGRQTTGKAVPVVPKPAFLGFSVLRQKSRNRHFKKFQNQYFKKSRNPHFKKSENQYFKKSRNPHFKKSRIRDFLRVRLKRIILR